ncbi:MAG: T9SS type A sorting domain-containing protein [Fluviicola sp.]|nr:T9SS type A sorting domain-containing protein [Fluviicola sp.]
MIVGESSHIRLTTDGGATWTYSSHWNPGMNLTKCDMANATQITCLFSSSPYWANVGNSWNSVTVSNLGYTQPYNDLWFNNGVGYVVGLNGIAKTTNFSTYTNQLSQANVGLNGVHFTSNDEGWAVGDQGKNYYTTDGGANWYNLAAATTSSLKAVHFVNPTHGWAVGENGTILKFNTCQNTSSILTVTACGSYTLNGQTYTSSNFYNQTVPNANGCDSLITLDLTITSPINNDVFLTGTTISATEAGLNYQWINCANNAPIAGANAQTFTPTANGSYAVIVSNSNCSDTSACQAVTISTSGIEEQTASNFNIYPNPAQDFVTLNNLTIGTTLQLTDMTGKTVLETSVSTEEMTIDLNGLMEGVYFVQILDNASIIGTKKLAISK